MKRSDRFPSNYLKAEALETSKGVYTTMVLTIESVSEHKFEDADNPHSVLHFKGEERTFGVTAKVNWESLEDITGQEDDQDWVGHTIELYVDKNVTFGGKRVPAIRIRKPEAERVNGQSGAGQAAAAAKAALPKPVPSVRMGKPGADRLAAAMAGKLPLPLELTDLRNHLSLQQIGFKDLIEADPSLWPAEWMATIKAWLDNPGAGMMDESSIPFSHGYSWLEF